MGYAAYELIELGEDELGWNGLCILCFYDIVSQSETLLIFEIISIAFRE